MWPTHYIILFTSLWYFFFRLQAESESWEALLNKHRSKAEELARWTWTLSLRNIVAILCWRVPILSSQLCFNNVLFICFRKVERGQEGGIPLDSASVAQSSQYHCIQSKPDYNALLCRQLPMLHTMTMIVGWKLHFNLFTPSNSTNYRQF